MFSNWLKSDWTLAHLLYYLAQIMCFMLAFYILVSSVMFIEMGTDGRPSLDRVPVRLVVDQYDGHDDIRIGNSWIDIPSLVNGKMTFIRADDESAGPVVVFFLFRVFGLLVLLGQTYLISRILKTVIRKKPFTGRNPLWLFILGWTILLMPFVSYLRNLYAQSWLETLPLPESVSVAIPAVDLNSALVGIVIVVLGYIFQEGSRLYREQQLTV